MDTKTSSFFPSGSALAVVPSCTDCCPFVTSHSWLESLKIPLQHGHPGAPGTQGSAQGPARWAEGGQWEGWLTLRCPGTLRVSEQTQVWLIVLGCSIQIGEATAHSWNAEAMASGTSAACGPGTPSTWTSRHTTVHESPGCPTSPFYPLVPQMASHSHAVSCSLPLALDDSGSWGRIWY